MFISSSEYSNVAVATAGSIKIASSAAAAPVIFTVPIPFNPPPVAASRIVNDSVNVYDPAFISIVCPAICAATAASSSATVPTLTTVAAALTEDYVSSVKALLSVPSLFLFT